MAASFFSTIGFFSHLLRDLAGTMRTRWNDFVRRVVHGEKYVVVGVDIFPFCERMTGVGWYEWNLLRAMDRHDHGLRFNLYAHTFLAPDEPPSPKIPGTRTMRLRVHQMPPGFLLPVRPTLFLLRALVEPVLRVLDGNDVLFAPNFFLARSQLPYGKSTVATVHDLAFTVMPQTVAPETLRDLRRHLPTTLFRSDRLIAVSEATSVDLAEQLGVARHRIHTVHEGLDPDFARAPDDPTGDDDLPKPYLLFLSTLEPRKNVIGVLQSFRLLVTWGYPGTLLLVGRWGWNTKSIREEMQSSPVADRIVQLDYVERERLPSLYRGADALLFPSWLEGFGLPLLEAMACGTPVITSGQSSMPEVAGPAAVYVDPASAHGIASAVAALLEDPSHRERLVAAGLKRVDSFSWDRAAAATAQVLRQAGGLEATGDDEYRV